jgi:hypothetical protein
MRHAVLMLAAITMLMIGRTDADPTKPFPADVGSGRIANGAISAFNGVVYVQVADIQASCKKSQELGATVVPGFPFDLPTGIGAIGLVLDPSGHPLGMYSRTPLAAASAPSNK